MKASVRKKDRKSNWLS